MLNKKHAIFFFLFILKKKGGRWIYSTKYCLKHDKQDIVQKPRGSTEDAAGMCPYTQHTHTDYTARWKKKKNHGNAKENKRTNSERQGEGRGGGVVQGVCACTRPQDREKQA